MAVLLTAAVLLLAGTTPAHAYDRTWKYSGSFKASLQSSSFLNNKAGDIRVTILPGGCSASYSSINFELLVQNSFTFFERVGKVRSIPCNKVTTLVYKNARKGTYRMYFSRTGPTTHDETKKTVSGVVSYW